jgi:uncharacterized protein DUF1176
MFAILITALASGGCQRRDQRSPGPEHSATRANPAQATSRSRAEWRQRVRWSDDCENAFSQTSSPGNGNGVRTYGLPEGQQLLEVRCAQGAYQPSQVFAAVAPGAAAGTLLTFPVATAADTGGAQWERAQEIWGTATFDAAAARLTVVNQARGLGDCGTAVVYEPGIAGRSEVAVVSARAKPCDDSAQPPDVWPVIPHP